MDNDYYPGDDFFWLDDNIDDDSWDDPCDRCGPWCEYWGGDGLCMVIIEQQAKETERFEQKYVSTQSCPHCNIKLTLYQIPTDQLWTWPGEWPGDEYYSPMIALDIFSVLGAPKGEVHHPIDSRFCRFHHIWVGEGEYRRESLIMLDKPGKT